ncbi:MSF1-domain-containing protein [Dichomitus squalens]|uniref:MSF1-domain-containing protein n=1 Tax=Dichomitus squalens TaxID=114155 RepID=A0A4Q9N313_9APHY|nr:MSF1-domain-containing protein [Dichomitus squalens LYAD-421 SS1]EJF66423.1 MSF1-domain-containing protein [Dichomitus squalens LYAD-421 SS1]TBU34934.1 MSF1-domain-containing protein [Dichomitus squalens]TBU47373.1 MSF1-domain-containing protein [Dichomitus squalens]TBU64751.1 MSF1-domain-containing protein [Dichomitus squalens]
MKFYSQSFLYDDPWSIVSLAYLLRYPNPYANHILSCDVISREVTPEGSLRTTRLILKKGSLPRWAPAGMIQRAESWVLEESEVDPLGKNMRCTTKNLDHVKVMRVEEHIHIRQAEDGKTLQTTEAMFLSGFGWGLTKKIENYGLAKFKANLQRSREGFFVILDLIRQSRMQPMTMGAPSSFLSHRSIAGPDAKPPAHHEVPAKGDSREDGASSPAPARRGYWARWKTWLGSG